MSQSDPGGEHQVEQDLRYSEDLDYVRRTNSGIGPYLDALRRIAADVGLSEHSRDRHGPMVQARYDAVPTSGAGLIRVKGGDQRR